MNKTFRKALACIIAVLMVASSMPFTALAADAWWEAEYGETPALGAVQIPTEYKTINEAYFDATGEEDYFLFGETIDSALDENVDNRSSYKPFVAMTLSSLGTNEQMADKDFRALNRTTLPTNYYGGSKKLSYQNAINMLNPAERLVQGQRIAITFEFGGFDILNLAQLKGTFDATKLIPASYPNNKFTANSDTWTTYTGFVPDAWATTATTYRYTDAFTSTSATTYFEEGQDTGIFYIALNSGPAQNGGMQNPVVITGSEDAIYGEFGYIIGSLCFEVTNDCYINDVITLDSSKSGTVFEIGDGYWTETFGDNLYQVTGGDYHESFARWTPVWTNVTATGGDEGHTHTYGDVEYTWADDNSYCVATKTCTDANCDETADGHTVTIETSTNITPSNDTATCTVAGTKTLTAAFTAEGTENQVKNDVPSAAKGHSFTGAVTHYMDGETNMHAKKCANCDAVDEANGVACTSVETVVSAPTCAVAGVSTWACPTCGESFGTTYPEATGNHTKDYSDVSYAWNADNTKYTATIGCATCDGTAATVEATVTPSSGSAATCQQTADTTYTATFADENLEGDIKTVPGAKGPHEYDYDNASYDWDGTTSCTATAKCKYCTETTSATSTGVTSNEKVAATCTEMGTTTYTAAFDAPFANKEMDVQDIPMAKHDYDYDNATYNWDGTTSCTATAKCKNCVATTTATSTGVTSKEKVASTCTVMGTTTYTAAFDAPFANKEMDVQDIPMAKHDYDYAKATYEWDGTTSCTATAKCKNCVDTTTATSTGVTSDEKIAPTCSVMGTTTYTATFDGSFAATTTDVQDIATVDHVYSVLKADKVPATVDAAGTEAVYECKFGCGETKGGEPIDQLAHYVINVTAKNGTATVNGKADTANVAINGNVTLAATPAQAGLTFVGWSLNGKIVSENETYVTKAIANADYVALYTMDETVETESSVVFTDVYGNVYSTERVAAGNTATAPAAPTLAGFNFMGWSVDGEIVDVATTPINANTTFIAVFERANAEEKYTITVAEGCKIDGEDVTSKDYSYNDICTVTAPAGSTNGTWSVDGAVVGYGTSYTFFVGASATLTYTNSDDVVATPIVVAVKAEQDGSSYKVGFFATRTTPAGYTYVNAGFVYGKDLTDDDLDLDNVGVKGSNANSGVVKAAYCSTGVEQFRLTYGIAAKNAPANVKAFLAYTDASGDTQVIYAAFDPFTYA